MYFYIALPLVLISTFTKGEPGPWPTWPRWVFEILLTLVFDDFLLYWLHRLSHWPSLYFMHKNHHEWLQPFGLTGAYMHPLEMALVSACSGAGTVLIMSHPYEVIPLLVFRAALHVEHHCGYAYPWNPQNWFPLCVGAHYHDWHHEAFVRREFSFKLMIFHLDSPISNLANNVIRPAILETPSTYGTDSLVQYIQNIGNDGRNTGKPNCPLRSSPLEKKKEKEWIAIKTYNILCTIWPNHTKFIHFESRFLDIKCTFFELRNSGICHNMHDCYGTFFWILNWTPRITFFTFGGLSWCVFSMNMSSSLRCRIVLLYTFKAFKK